MVKITGTGVIVVSGDPAKIMYELEKLTIDVIKGVSALTENDKNKIRKKLNARVKEGLKDD